MNRIKQAVTSRTVWTILALVIINGVPAVTEMFPPSIIPYVDIVLGLLATYLKVTPSQKYGER